MNSAKIIVQLMGGRCQGLSGMCSLEGEAGVACFMLLPGFEGPLYEIMEKAGRGTGEKGVGPR